MENKIKCSVAMATYNGEKYIKEQIDSILLNLDQNDELIISDDGSTDETLNIIKNYNDSRIKLIQGPKKGIKQNFANAIKNCNGQYIFLSDQDDIWNKNKKKIVLDTFEKNNCTLVVHDCEVINNEYETLESSFFELRKSKKGIVKNIIKNSYIGCCMCFDSKIKNKILPIPNDIEMHDQWIGIIAEKYGESIFIKDKLIKYRRHDNNASGMKHHPLNIMIKNRLNFIKNYRKR